MGSNSVVEQIFHQREDFIIIGLTGRTGSGCSKVAELMGKEKFNIPKPNKCEDLMSNSERKHKIVYKFLDEKWNPFIKISMSNIILSFLFSEKNLNFKSLISNYIGSKEFDEEIKQYNFLKDDYETNVINFKNEKIDNEDKYSDTKEFYLTKLTDFKDRLRELLGDNYTEFMQDMGNSLRKNGLISSKSKESKVFCLSQRLNKLIKVLRYINENNKQKDYFVIDAFRNAYEALFFKERFSAFYLFAINTTEKERTNRLLKKKGFSYEKLKEIDENEYPEKNDYSLLNIQTCIENADIHINNPDNEIPNDFSLLKKRIAKYISLIMHPGLVTPDKKERCMQIAYTAKFNSGCISRQVGAVVTDKDYSIKSVGWNDVPYGQIPCLLRSIDDLIDKEDQQAYSEYELKNEDFVEYVEMNYSKDSLKARNHSFCFKDLINNMKHNNGKKNSEEDSEKGKFIKNQVYTRSLHAEENAFLQIAKYGGQGVHEGILFTTASPCELCSKKAYQLGISKIIYIDPYPGIAMDHILKSGNNQPELELFSGAIGRAYHQIYEPIMPYKDELKLLRSN